MARAAGELRSEGADGTCGRSVAPAGGYGAHALRVAMLVQFPLWLLGAYQVLRLRSRDLVQPGHRDEVEF